MVQRWWVVHVIVIVVVVVVVIMPVTVMARGAVAGGIEWQPYAAPLLPPEMRGFFRHTHEAYVDVPMCYAPAEMQAEGVRGRTFRLYVRRFSPTATPARHIWHVTGGPGVSSDGIERVLGTRFDDLAIYIMDPRGLDRSQEYGGRGGAGADVLACVGCFQCRMGGAWRRCCGRCRTRRR